MADSTPLNAKQMSKPKQKSPKLTKQPLKKVEASVSDAPTKKAPTKRYFTKRLYIGGFGMVDVGDLLTKEALDAWKAKTKVSIANYVDKG